MNCIFFGDTHLARRDSNRHAFVRNFIEQVCTEADIVFILGDLFEFYHGHNGYLYPWYRNVIDSLRDLAARGTVVYYLEGNHEFDMGPFFSSHTGVTCVRNLTMEIDGKKTFLSHGDESAGTALAKALKSPFTYKIMNALGPSLTWKIAMACKIFLSKKRRAYNQKVRDRFRVYAKKKLDGGYDTVVLAHTHMSDFVEYGSGDRKKIYMNTGGLIENLTYADYTTCGGFSVKHYRL